jgi:hypothetical protein
LKRRIAAVSAVGAATVVVTVSAFALTAGASGASSSLPTLKIALTGKTGVSVSQNTVASGAVSVVTTFSGKGHGSFGIVRLNDGITLQQAVDAVQSHHGDLNALTQYGALIVSADAPGKVQTVLSPSDNYYALNTSGHQPAIAPFKVSKNSSPAALPKASATQKAIEFGFNGPNKLHRGTIVRERNKGYLVHMIDLVGAKNKRAAHKLASGLHQGKPQRALRPYLNGQFVNLLNPASPGALQQSVLHAKRGYYVEACFMDTMDGREHTQLGMERVVRVVG